jgi:hypothetical protein
VYLFEFFVDLDLFFSGFGGPRRGCRLLAFWRSISGFLLVITYYIKRLGIARRTGGRWHRSSFVMLAFCIIGNPRGARVVLCIFGAPHEAEAQPTDEDETAQNG